MSFNLNMAYYHIKMSEDAIDLCKIIIPWVKYHYMCLSMGVSNYPNIFQHKLNGLLQGIEFIYACIENF